MSVDIDFIGEYEIQYVKLDPPLTNGVEYEVIIRVLRDDRGRPISDPTALFLASGKTPEEGLRKAEDKMQTWVAKQRTTRHTDE
jgi:hypothetical protein